MGKLRKVVFDSMVTSMGNLGDGLIVTGFVAMLVASQPPLVVVFSLVTGVALRGLAFAAALCAALINKDE